MTRNNENFYQLRNKLDLLMKRHQKFSREVFGVIENSEAFSEEINKLVVEIDKILIEEAKVLTSEKEIEKIKDIGRYGPPIKIENNDLKDLEKITVKPEAIFPVEPKIEAVKLPEMVRSEEPIKNNLDEKTKIAEIHAEVELPQKVSSFKEKTVEPIKPIKSLPKEKSNIERFIGENLIAILGIIILLVGVGIGVKLAIDKNIIGPATRVTLGYIMGVGLLGFGVKLKKNYEKFSAILVSGSIAIMYFVTFFAYDFYQFMSIEAAFGLMVIFTVFAAITAINYNRQIIAHIGLVGAYAVPILLSKGSGQIVILFSYMAIINIGILTLAFKKYWKPLYYVSFCLTWFAYISWYFNKYQTKEHFSIALIFLFIFFLIFYIIFLAYKLLRNEKYAASDILFLIGNSFLFYILGYKILDDHTMGKDFVGLFTLINAVLHFVVALIFYKQKKSDENLFYLVIGMSLTFLTIAIPIQLNGNWVTLLWSCEAAALFWLGRTKYVSFYEKISYVLMVLGFISIINDWQTVYSGYIISIPESKLTPIFNINFLTSMIFIASFSFINILYQSKKYVSLSPSIKELQPLIQIIIPTFLLVVLYFSFFLEISTYWDQLYLESFREESVAGMGMKSFYNTDIQVFKTIWIINYSLLMFSVISMVNFKKIKNENVGTIFIVLNIFALFIFLTQSLSMFGDLREAYLMQSQAMYFEKGFEYIRIRYLSYAFVVMALISIYQFVVFIVQKTKSNDLKAVFEIVLSAILLWIASSELISVMELIHSKQSFKLVLSILWSLIALFLIAYGIWKRKKHLRIGAMVIFSVVILKIFFYDLAHLNTISKTIVLVVLGLLMLISSFLYNKYKHLMVEEETNETKDIKI